MTQAPHRRFGHGQDRHQTHRLSSHKRQGEKMRTIKLIAAAALIGAFGLIGTATASADSTSCSAAGTIKLSPGLTTTPTTQNVSVKGTLSGCASVESEATEGKFNAHFKTAEPIDCETLTGAGVGAAAEESKIILKLKPKGSGNAQGPVSLLIREGEGALSGSITSEGPFFEDTVAGSLTQTYTGGATCGIVPEGKKKAKKVSKGTFTGTVSVS
jgi:hypothetical protein